MFVMKMNLPVTEDDNSVGTNMTWSTRLFVRLKKTFSVQQDVDASLFDTVLSY